jgi:hypothetical protein
MRGKEISVLTIFFKKRPTQLFERQYLRYRERCSARVRVRQRRGRGGEEVGEEG